MSTPEEYLAQPTDADQFMQAAMEDKPDYNAQECADVKAWLKRINEAREFDKAARKQYALDRRYARGDAGQFEVSIPIAGTYIDILKSFLYARDPDLDIMPADATNPPPMAEIMEMARAQVMSDPQAQAMMQQVGQQAAASAATANAQATLVGVGQALTHGVPKTSPPQPTVPPEQAAQAAIQGWIDQAVRQAAKKILAPYRQRQDDAKQLGQTLEIVIERLWKQGRLKAQGQPLVGSCLSVGIGWLKASWQQRMGKDPIIQSQLSDMQDNLERIAATQEEIEDGGNNTDELRASLQQQMEGLQARVEVIVARGMAIDFINAEDIQVAPQVGTLEGYRDAPWIAHRTFMTLNDARAAFPTVEEDLSKANIYFQQKPSDNTDRKDIGPLANVSDVDADSYRSGAAGSSLTSSNQTGDGSVCVWEVWNKDANSVLTLVEGLEKYAKPTYAPDPGTTRFYPFFALSMLRVDGERHPQSMISRTRHLLDDMNRIYSNRAEHRRRAIPKTGFDATLLDASQAKKLEMGAIGEMVGLHPSRQGEPIANAIAAIAYPPIDINLYDDRPTRAMLEMSWGIQEALAASVRTAKTATEAEIQQTGTNARTSYMRDCIDSLMDDLAQYTAEVSLQKMDRKDVEEIAGPWAFWPEGITIDGLSVLLTVSVKGGSSGKPDTTAQQQSWAATMPVLQNAIMQVGQLRQSAPSDIADGIQELVAETLNRTGDRLDPSRFLPPVPAEQPGPMPQMPAQLMPEPSGAAIPIPPSQGGANLLPVPHNGMIDGHRPN